MGIRPATDIFQSRMVSIFQPMKANKPNPYIDDIFHGKGQDYNSHLHILGDIFTPLLEAGMQVNLSMSKLCNPSGILRFLIETEWIPTNMQMN
jgi:hypothetical protein